MFTLTETIFKANGKKGILKPDENGYFDVILGALNAYNSVGEYYTLEGSVELFKNSSVLMRRISKGALYSELGHPTKEPWMSFDDFYLRILKIDEKNVCGHISEIRLDYDYVKNNPNITNKDMVIIMGKVKPTGPHSQVLYDSLINPKQNSAFSIRGITRNIRRNGRIERILENIVTWDYVLEPGIDVACKAYFPSTESLNIYTKSDIVLDKEKIINMYRMSKDKISMESKEIILDIIKSISKDDDDHTLRKILEKL
ncbi:MAG: S80 family phage morphogenetic serine protease [Candidatus Aenigmatarchaeota archaeon]